MRVRQKLDRETRRRGRFLGQKLSVLLVLVAAGSPLPSQADFFTCREVEEMDENTSRTLFAGVLLGAATGSTYAVGMAANMDVFQEGVGEIETHGIVQLLVPHTITVREFRHRVLAECATGTHEDLKGAIYQVLVQMFSTRFKDAAARHDRQEIKVPGEQE